MDSILISIKKLLGISADYKHFDDDIIMHINSVFLTLSQIGIGPPEGYMIHDEYAVWSDFLGEDPRLEAVKSYMYYKVRLLFDPPTASAVMESANRIINEFEWRLNVAAETMQE